MGDDDHGHVDGGEAADDLEDFTGELGVEGGGGFVEEEDVGLQGQGAGDGDALLLASGELEGIGVGLLGEAHLVQQGHRDRAGLVGGTFEDVDLRLGDVAENGKMRKKVEILEDEAHAEADAAEGVLFGVDAVADHGVLADEDGPAGDLFQVGDAAQEGGLAAAGGADDGHDVAFVDGEGDVAQDREVAEGFRQVPHIDQRRRLVSFVVGSGRHG